MHQLNHLYFHGSLAHHGYLAYKTTAPQIKRPAVLIVHDWSGRNAFACQQAEKMAERGYVGFSLDMYGEGRCGETVAEKQALMQPLMADRQLLRKRITAGLNALSMIDVVDQQRIAVIGFCFGGLCALDLARSGASIKAAISVHGLLNKPAELDNQLIQAKVMILHGYDDPMVTPADVHAFCQEMTKAEVDWQAHLYGNTQHAFTNPQAHDEHAGTVYNALAAGRAQTAMTAFLQEAFA